MPRGRPRGSTNSPESIARRQLTNIRKRLAKEGRPPSPEEEEKIHHWETVIGLCPRSAIGSTRSETLQEDHRAPTGAPPVAEEEVPTSTPSEPVTYDHRSGGIPDADGPEDRLVRCLEAEVRAAVAPLQMRQDALEEQIKDARYDIGMLTRQLVKFSERLEQHDHPPPEILQQLVSGDQALRKWVENQEAEIRRQLDTIEDQHRQDLKRVEDTIAVTDGMHYVADILKEINKNLQKLTKAVQGPGGSP
ncbi:MAG: hypothetical protein QMC96_12200 [Methanomicrobiales archaeon]|nr:hypothetical protein [Methanomicrobiales archaeon]